MRTAQRIFAVIVCLVFVVSAGSAAQEKPEKPKLQLTWAKPKGAPIREPATTIPNVEYKNLTGEPIKNGYGIVRLIAVGEDGKPVEPMVEGKKLEFAATSGTEDMFMYNFVVGSLPLQLGVKLSGVGTVTYTVYETTNPEAPSLANSKPISNVLKIKYSLDQR